MSDNWLSGHSNTPSRVSSWGFDEVAALARDRAQHPTNHRVDDPMRERYAGFERRLERATSPVRADLVAFPPEGDGVGRSAAAVIAAAIAWFEWEAAHAPDGGPYDPRDTRLYRVLADPDVRENLRAAVGRSAAAAPIPRTTVRGASSSPPPPRAGRRCVLAFAVGWLLGRRTSRP